MTLLFSAGPNYQANQITFISTHTRGTGKYSGLTCSYEDFKKSGIFIGVGFSICQPH
jgi:hypothetical protein